MLLHMFDYKISSIQEYLPESNIVVILYRYQAGLNVVDYSGILEWVLVSFAVGNEKRKVRKNLKLEIGGSLRTWIILTIAFRRMQLVFIKSIAHSMRMGHGNFWLFQSHSTRCYLEKNYQTPKPWHNSQISIESNLKIDLKTVQITRKIVIRASHDSFQVNQGPFVPSRLLQGKKNKT